MVTDDIDRLVPEGIRPASGTVLGADIIVLRHRLQRRVLDTARRPVVASRLPAADVHGPADRFPRQGDNDPWTTRQNYIVDMIRTIPASLRRDMTFAAASAPAVLQEVAR